MSWYDREYARSEPAARAPLRLRGRSMVTTLIVLNVLVFALTAMGGPTGLKVWLLGAMQTDAVLHGQLWRLITSQYLHSLNGFGHILFNMLGLYVFGSSLEQLWGRRKFLAVYTLAGLAGNLFYLALGVAGWADPTAHMIGASGCILGLLGAAAVLFPTQVVYVQFFFPVRVRTLALIFGALYAVNIFMRGANFGGDAAHLAGMAFGAWWAWTGDRWWTRRRWRPRGADQQHAGFRQAVQQRADDARTIDEILAKVHRNGIDSLSWDERRALQEATERQRHDEARFGRTDRL